MISKNANVDTAKASMHGVSKRPHPIDSDERFSEWVEHECIDMHCHLDFFTKEEPPSNAQRSANGDGANVIEHPECYKALSMTVDPRDYEAASKRFEITNDVKVAAGLHPRWIADGLCTDAETELLCALLLKTPFIGEVGLDFSKRYSSSSADQTRAFEKIVSECSHLGGKVISVHALKSLDVTLDMVEQFKLNDNCSCILHWFNGSTDQLWRAIRMGCMFSVNDRMLATKRGPEYLKVIPERQLLLETDLPSAPHSDAKMSDLRSSLERSSTLISAVKGMDCLQQIAEHSANLLSR